jgi:hypothetical protein
MITIALILAVLALFIAIYSAVKPQPVLWIAVVLLAILELLRAAVPLAR